MNPVLHFVFEIRARIELDLHIGRGPEERLSFTPISGGSVSGPRLKGEVLPGGGDWAVERFGTAQLEARYLIKADDGAVIDILNRGYFRASAEVAARMHAGETIPEDEPGLYFRTAPVFQTDAPQHQWLTEHQFIGMARDEGDDVCIRVYLLA